MSEEKLLARLAALAGNEDYLYYDAAGPAGLLINIDGYAASSSKLPFMSWSDWAYKSVIAAASDVIAAGGTPEAIAYSVGSPSADPLESIARGVGEASSYLGAKVYKADANRSSSDTWIDVTVVGTSSRPVSRAGAKAGDVLVQVGYLGYGAVAYKVLRGALSLSDVPHEVLDLIVRPRIMKSAGTLISRVAHASSDNSDGWLTTIYNIASASRVLVSIDDMVLDPGVEGLINDEEAANSWEDYNIAVVVPPDLAEDFVRGCGTCFIVGKVKEGSGVELKGREAKPKGWSWW